MRGEQSNDDLSFLAGGGEMGERARALDWASTPVGSPEQWPQSLKTAVSICLGSRYPIVIWWGNPAYTMFYNDGYIPVLGVTKHPGWLGRSGRECWSEIWSIIGPMLDGVFASGEATWSEDLLLVMDRNRPREECYFTFSYSPIRDDNATVAGIFCACYETTGRVIGERRLRTLRDLSRMEVAAKTAEGACEVAARTLGENPADIPFALIYLLDGDGRQARLVATTGLQAGSAAAPHHIDLGTPDRRRRGRCGACSTRAAAELLHDLPATFGALPGGPWPESTRRRPDRSDCRSRPGRPDGLPGRRPQPAARGRRRLPQLPRSGGGPHRHRHRQRPRLRGGAQARRGAGRARPRQDRLLLQRQPRVPHAAHADARAAGGRCWPQSPALPAADRERLELAHRNALRLLKLVNTLLDFSRIEAGRIEASYEPTDLAALTAELASVFRSAIERAGHAARRRLPAACRSRSTSTARCGRRSSSTCSRTPSSSRSTARSRSSLPARRRDRRADACATPAPASRPTSCRACSSASTASRARAGARYEGTGIGLALVQELVKLHGGTVARRERGRTAAAASPCRIPLGSGASAGRSHRGRRAASASTGLRPDAYVEEALRWLPDGQRCAGDVPNASGGTPSAQPPPAARPRPRILLADDNADMRDYVRRLLTQGGYEVEAVADGQAAPATRRGGARRISC